MLTVPPCCRVNGVHTCSGVDPIRLPMCYLHVLASYFHASMPYYLVELDPRPPDILTLPLQAQNMPCRVVWAAGRSLRKSLTLQSEVIQKMPMVSRAHSYPQHTHTHKHL
eukprot:1159156-Pelagomonas_calceolata.AAC.3